MNLRSLPSIEKVLSSPELSDVVDEFQRRSIVSIVRECMEEARSSIRDGGEIPSLEDIANRARRKIVQLGRVHPRMVINATGVIIHTNLGRAPLSHSSLEAMQEAASAYSNLELDLVEGVRGSRQKEIQNILRYLVGSESALVVNNNAAALLLGISTVAQGKEVIISRSEAVEIGGGFRIPEVLSQSGAKLVEVGTTNRTYITDYRAAITENTGALLKVHTSNFKIVGFTHSVSTPDLVGLGKEFNVPVLHDVGSGCLLRTSEYGLLDEPTPQDSVSSGVDLVFFSGDKLLGGPQAGIIVGSECLIKQMSNHPLARALRIDKISLAGLIATLLHYLRDEVTDMLPIWSMISMGQNDIKTRALHWKQEVGSRVSIVATTSAIGGGSLPDEVLDSWALALSCDNFIGGAERIARALRHQVPPIIARIDSGHVLLDPRTVLPSQDQELISGLRQVLEMPSS